MKDLRKNEFIDMLEMAEILFEDKGNFIQCDIPTLGSITYYPKANKVQINRTNAWEEGGYEFVKNIIGNPTKVFEKPNVIKVNPMRDDFAKAAMQGIISNQEFLTVILRNADANERSSDAIVRECYAMADAMIKHREL